MARDYDSDGNRFETRNDRHEYCNARRPEFSRGASIPRDYRSHQWVQIGPDYVLITIAAGLIANITLNY